MGGLDEDEGELELADEEGALELAEDEGRAEELETGAALLESEGTAPGRREAGVAFSGLVTGEAESETGVFMAGRKMNGLSTHRTEKQE